MSAANDRVSAFRTLLRGVEDFAAFSIDAQGRIADWTSGARRMFGYDDEEIVGQPFDLLFPEDGRVAGAPAYAMRAAAETGRFLTNAMRVRRGGEAFWAAMSMAPITDESGRVTGYAILMRDCGAEREANETAAKTEKSFRLLVNSVVDYAIYMLDRDGRVASWNPGAERAKGYTADQILGRHFSCFYPEESRAAGDPEAALKTAREAGKFETEGWRLRKDGSRFWASVVIDPVYDDAGDLVGYAKITKDCTERNAMREAAQESENRFRLLVKGVTDYAIYMLNRSGRVTNWNAGAERAKGYLEEEILGQHFSVFYSAQDRADGLPQRALDTALREGRFEGTGWRYRKDGTRFWASVVIDALYDDDGAHIGYAKITRDITRQKEDEDKMRALIEDQRNNAIELERAMKKAMAANEAKSAFLATMSHEIRTPLNGVLGMAQVMYGDNLTEAQRERMRIIIDSGNALLTILNDVLDISKIEAGELKLVHERFALEDVVRTACATFSEAAREKGIDLDFEIAPGGGGAFLGDAARLRQILSNLISNAVKFTEGGQIRIRAERGADGATLLRVRDTGIGVPAHQLGQIFDNFAQADSTSTRVHGGSGLGLAISRKLARAMDGDISVTSVQGEGSEFILEVPLERDGADLRLAEPAMEPVRDAPQSPGNLTGPFAGVSILLAEDNQVNQIVVQSMLQPTGADVTLAVNGREALELCRRQAFDLILMDIRMPELDGVAATRAIRDLEAGRDQPTPIVALTANALDHQVKEYRDAGMDDCVTKPVTKQTLYDAIERALALRGKAGDREAAEG